MKIHGLAQHEALLALKKARSCGGTREKSHGMLLFVSQRFGVDFGGKEVSQTLKRVLNLSSNVHNESSYLSLYHGRIQEYK